VKRFVVVTVVIIGMGFCGRVATAQQTGSAQSTGNAQQSQPAQKPDAGQPATPGQNAAPAQAPGAAVPAASTTIVGKWHFVMDTPGGDREADADLSVDQDGKVTGKFGTSDVVGTYKDGKLDLDFPFTSEELGQTAELKFAGKLDDASELTGTWEFISYSGTFKAARPKAQA
jgi:hypothetical protein